MAKVLNSDTNLQPGNRVLSVNPVGAGLCSFTGNASSISLKTLKMSIPPNLHLVGRHCHSLNVYTLIWSLLFNLVGCQVVSGICVAYAL